MRLTFAMSRRPLRSMAMLLATLLSLSVLMAVAPATTARAAELPSSIADGGFIISDAEFFDGDAMTAAQVQSFLQVRVPTCRATTGPTCLRGFTADLPAKAKDSYCGAITAKKKVRASEIIATVARACDISPRVILVMLQKEQGLVTSTRPSEWSYRASMGMNCPDTAPCSAASAGFVNQVYLGARQQQVYADNPTRYSYRAGRVNTVKWHPNSACGTSKVFIENQATANLYIYTPYRPNIAALAAGYATGDSCSSYGNRNFYNYYVQWFAPEVSPHDSGAPARVDACTVPRSADVSAASATATVKTATTARKAPVSSCASGSKAFAASTKVTVTGTYGAWSRVANGSGSLWVSSSALSTSSGTPAGGACAVPAEASVTKDAGTVTVTTDSLNARKAPSTSCDTGKRAITRGQNYQRTGTYGDWWRIVVSGTTYWAHSDYLAVTPAASTMYLATTTNMTPTATSAVIAATLRKGTAVKTISISGDRTQITVGGTTGWVFTSKLAVKNPGAVSGQIRQAIASTPLRATASASGKVLTTLPKAGRVTVHDTFGAWRAVTSGSTQGWMRDSELTAVTPTPTPTPTPKPTPTPTKPATKTMYLSAPDNMAPSATSRTIQATVRKGTKVTASSASGTRTQVTVDGMTGWVTSSKLVATNPGAVSGQDRQSIASTPLRATASASGRVLTTLKAGTKVTVHDTWGIWRAVTAGSTKGWMRGSELTSVSAAPATKTMYLAKTTNMTPSASSKAILGTLRKGTTVKAGSVSGDRTQVTADGVTGWVFTSTLSTKNPGAVSGQARQVIASTPLRLTASGTGKVVKTLPAGTKVTAHDVWGVWRAVTAGSTKGWMRDAELKKASAAPTTSVKTTTAALNFRATPSTSGRKISVIPKGTKVTVTGTSGTWRKVTYRGTNGWVSGDFLR